MARPPGLGKCAHCLGGFDVRNWDHVFPAGWYPSTTPKDIAKWQIPSCGACNSAYGRLEEDFIARIGLCLDPDDPDTAHIVAKVMRAVDANCGRDEKDSQLREARRQRLLRDMLTGNQIPTEAIYPNFGERWGRPQEEQGAITIPAESVRRIAEKIARGIFFIEDGLFIEPPYKIEFYAMHNAGAADITRMLKCFGKIYAREPGIEVIRAVTPEDGISSLMRITLFKQFHMYVAITRSDG